MDLKQLCEINSVSGDEDGIRKYILKELDSISNIKYSVDKIGNIIVYKKGLRSSEKTIMVAAHMDEVGFIVSSISDDGYIKFKCVGGLDKRILLSKKVLIGENDVPGIIGVKAIHLQQKEEREKPINVDDMYIDIGADFYNSAKDYISVGDYIAFDSQYSELGNHKVSAKALDDRAGCSILLKLLKNEYPIDVCFCFTVQEETGLRGAKVVSEFVKPDICMVIETTSCFDLPNVTPNLFNTMLGKGVAISILDRGSFTDTKLREFIVDLAKAKDIKYQYKKTSFGANDAGSVVTSYKGCKVISFSVPCRNIHSPACVIDLRDYDNTLSLAYEFLINMEEYLNDK